MNARRCFGWNMGEGRCMEAIATGKTADGKQIYTECDTERNLFHIDAQYTCTRKIKAPSVLDMPVFIRI